MFLFFCFEKVKMKCTRLGCYLRFIRLCRAGEAYFAACILMRETARMKEVWRGCRGWRDCVTLLHNTICTAFSPSLVLLSLSLSLLAPPIDRDMAEQAGGRAWKGAGVNEGDVKRCAPRWKIILHYGAVSNNASDEEKLFGRWGDEERKPPACLRLKLGHQVAFKWVCWVIKVDKMLLLSPSAHLRMAGVELTGICQAFWMRTAH